YDVATVFAFLEKYGLEREFKVNIEVNHATLSGHDFEHEVATAVNYGIFGSVDANAGDDRLGWDLDRFPGSVETMTLGILEILRGGGFHHRRHDVRHQAAAAVDRARRPVHRPHRRDGHARPRAARRRIAAGIR